MKREKTQENARICDTSFDTGERRSSNVVAPLRGKRTWGAPSQVSQK